MGLFPFFIHFLQVLQPVTIHPSQLVRKQTIAVVVFVVEKFPAFQKTLSKIFRSGTHKFDFRAPISSDVRPAARPNDLLAITCSSPSQNTPKKPIQSCNTTTSGTRLRKGRVWSKLVIGWIVTTNGLFLFQIRRFYCFNQLITKMAGTKANAFNHCAISDTMSNFKSHYPWWMRVFCVRDYLILCLVISRELAVKLFLMNALFWRKQKKSKHKLIHHINTRNASSILSVELNLSWKMSQSANDFMEIAFAYVWIPPPLDRNVQDKRYFCSANITGVCCVYGCHGDTSRYKSAVGTLKKWTIHLVQYNFKVVLYPKSEFL